jgi:hypothetical protein
MQRIVYTRPDGGVNICCPAREIMAHLTCGGFFANPVRGVIDRHVEAEIAAGRPEWLAHRYVKALAFGGCTTAEALEIIRDRDCAPHGAGFEVWRFDDFPQDRWFRNAWRRSHNGGPIYTDMATARKIQMKRLQTVANQRHATLQENRWRERIRRAETPEQLKNIWPKGLMNGASV